MIASPARKKPKSTPNETADDYFDDNFSQYFQTQFFREIPNGENESLNVTASNFSQWPNESQFNESITPGQQCLMPPSTQLPNRTLTQSVRPLQRLATVNDDVDDVDDLDDSAVISPVEQCSQLFLNEVSAINHNITSMINATLNANKSNLSELAVDNSQDKFTVFRSNVTMSEYVQLQRSPSDVDAVQTQYIQEPEAPPPLPPSFDPNDDEDDLLAAFALDEELNGAKAKYENAVSAGGEVLIQRVPSKPSPVTAANFYVMGPYFGLPLKVKKLIKEYKGIDDLYGTRTIVGFFCYFIELNTDLVHCRLAKGMFVVTGH